MPKIKVNGQEMEAAPGKRLLEVLTDAGVHVPHYCWHPGLSPHGNCRMCLCKVSTSRKLEVSCMVAPSEGMEVTTEGPDIDAARKSVMEYLLINHPLDCPICDKAGECRLQDYTYEYREGLTRFGEHKVIRHTKDLGPKIKIWGNRCISCTRCVRFCDEVTGTSELTMAYRGDHQVVDTHPGTPIDNPMSLNVVDLCPVGALNDKHFLYSARVWFSKRVDTTCTGCSKGCNVTVTTHKSEVKRTQPRLHEDVNGYWMCDAGRETDWLAGERRLKLSRGKVRELATALQQHAGAVAIVASTGATLEEVYLIRALASALRARVGWLGKDGPAWRAKSGWTIEADKTPNRAGVERVFGSLDGWEEVARGAASGEIRAALVLANVPDLVWPEALVAALAKLSVLAVADIQDGPLVAGAGWVLPAAAFAEKDGTIMNKDGLIQRIRPAIPAPGQARPESVWLQEILVAIGARRSAVSAEGVFREAFPGLDYAQVGSRGVRLSQAPSPSPESAGVR